MKLTTLAVIIVAGISASTFGQSIFLQNVGTGAGGTNGAVYMLGGVTKFDGLVNNLGVQVFGGPDRGSLQPMGLPVYKANTDPKGYTGVDLGTFQLGATGQAINVPGVVAGGVATIWLQMWFDGSTPNGLFPNYAAACAGGGLTASVIFLQNTANPPLRPPPSLSGMPDVVLGAPIPCLPEPSTLALAGLGLASLLVFRRRK